VTFGDADRTEERREVEELPPLTPRMRRTLQRALELAQENGQGVVGTEHVLLALLADRDGIAGRTLHETGLARAMQAEIARIITSEGYKTPSWVIKHSHDVTSSDAD
jgi:ATP-dependent Clp protease ATP-binding subunit ClpA